MTLRNQIISPIESLLSDKTLGSKEKTETIARYLNEKPATIDQLRDIAAKAKDPVKATCIEAVEYVSKENPAVVNEAFFLFVSESLLAKAPRIKWESARVIANTARLFPEKLDTAISNLLVNTEHPGTVVRWSAATALGEIIKLNTFHNPELMPTLEAIAEREEKQSIRKIYLAALKMISNIPGKRK